MPDPENKIVRPRQVYKGQRGRDYVPLEERKEENLAIYLEIEENVEKCKHGEQNLLVTSNKNEKEQAD